MKFNFFYIFLFILAACGSKSKDQASSSIESNNDLSKVKLTELGGQTIDLSQYEGKTVFINFWATWCKPCIQEMPTIEIVQDKMKNEKIVFLFASNEEIERIQKFMNKRPYKFHYVHLENLEELKIQVLPTTSIFNGKGKLKFSESGFRKWDDTSNIELITKIMNEHEK